MVGNIYISAKCSKVLSRIKIMKSRGLVLGECVTGLS